MLSRLRKICIHAAAAFCYGSASFGQSPSLTLSSGSVAPGGTVTLSLSLNAGSPAPASLQWTLNYSTVDILAVSMSAGVVSSAAGKSLSCMASPGLYTCIDSGMNTNTIAPGVVALATVTLAPTTLATTINVTSDLGATADGLPLAITGSSGTITVVQPTVAVSSLVCNPSSLGSNATSTCTVFLSSVVPAGGITLTVSSDNAALGVPATVNVSSGSSVNFGASTGTLTADGMSNVTAGYNGSSARTSIGLVAPVRVTSVACIPSSLGSNGSSSCTVSLSKPVPNGGITLAIGSDNAALTVPASVSVTSGSSISFNATTGILTSDGTANITASYNGSSARATISLAISARITSLACNPSALGSRATSTCTVNLSNNVPAGGITITVSSNLSAVVVPASLIVTSGSTGTFSATTGNLKSSAAATVTVSYSGSSASTAIALHASGRRAVEPPTLSSLTCEAATLAPGVATTCTVTVMTPASDTAISLQSIDGILSHPDSVPITEDSSSVSFGVSVKPSAFAGTATLTAAYQGTTRNVTFEIAPPAILSSLTCAPSTVAAGSIVNCDLAIEPSLSRSAELFIQVMVNHPSVQVPSLLKAQSNRTTLRFQCAIDRSAGSGIATITAKTGSNPLQQTLTLVPASAPWLITPGLQYARVGDLLQFTVSAEGAEHAPIAMTVSDAPNGATFDPQSGRFEWVPQAGQIGRHRIQFTATNTAGFASSASVEVSVDEGKPVIEALFNAASHSTDTVCSAGSVATLRGRWLSRGVADDPSGEQTELAGAIVKVNGERAPLIHASMNQVDFVCPAAVEPGTILSVSVENQFGSTEPVTIVTANVAPGIFSLDGSGKGQGVVMLAGSSDLAIVRNPAMKGQPVQAGDVIAIYATGLSPQAQPIIKIAGSLAEILTATPVQDQMGVWEIQARVPANLSTTDRVGLVLEVLQPDHSVVRSNEVTFAVESLT